MPEGFTVRDRRSSRKGAAPSSLITENLNAEISAIHKQGGIGGPSHPLRNREYTAEAIRETRNPTLVSSVRESIRKASEPTDASEMRRNRMSRTASTQIAVPRTREPLSTWEEKGIPYEMEKEEERKKVRMWCNTPDAPVWMADYTFKEIGSIEVGDEVIGWVTDLTKKSGRRKLTKSRVLQVSRRVAPEVVEITLKSGRKIRCTPDHEWADFRPRLVRDQECLYCGQMFYGSVEKNFISKFCSNSCSTKWQFSTEEYRIKRLNDYIAPSLPRLHEYSPARVGSKLRHVIEPTPQLETTEEILSAGYLAAMIDGEGHVEKHNRDFSISQSHRVNPDICRRIEESFDTLSLPWRSVSGTGEHLGISTYSLKTSGSVEKHTFEKRQWVLNIANWCRPVKFTQSWLDKFFLTSNFGSSDEVISIESLGSGEVVSLQTETGNYTAWGYASKNCRMYYATHTLMGTCIDVYSRFPIQGMELTCKDPEIVRFYEQLFFEELDWAGDYLIDFSREYWISGEVTSLGNFNETLGVWDADEILNPDDIVPTFDPFTRKTKFGIKVPQYLRDMLENESSFDSRVLRENYPEIVSAISSDETLSVSDVLISRQMNKISPWDTYGTPQMLRCFQQLLMEEGLNAAQSAIADRLYAPLILAKLGMVDAGDGQPWIPDPEERDLFTEDLQTALAADFRLMVHHFGVDIQNVFGRESMPRFDQDYDRLETKQLQVWGIGSALLTGSGSDTYASSALNRDFVTQLMSGWQRNIRNHFKKRAEVVAEAQEHFDYEMSGGIKKPIYEEVVVHDPTTGEETIQKRPKLLIPDLNFATLNLRDEATERNFLSTLKDSGVPISDAALMVNIPFEFEDEIEKIQQEKVKKVVAEAEFKKRARAALESQGLKDFAPEGIFDNGGQQPVDPNDPNSGESAGAPTSAIPDLVTDPVPTPNVSPVGEENPSAAVPPLDPTPQPGTTLPKNQISQRPEISDEYRSRAPRAASIQNGPLVVNLRNKLRNESIEDAIKERAWEGYAKSPAKFALIQDK